MVFCCLFVFRTVQILLYSSRGKSKGGKRKNAASEPFHSEVVSKMNFTQNVKHAFEKMIRETWNSYTNHSVVGQTKCFCFVLVYSNSKSKFFFSLVFLVK